MRAHFLDFLTDESGVTALEYGLIAALVSVASVGVLMSLGGYLTLNYEHIDAALPR